jgi:NADPH2:quinone reductase
VESVGSGVTTCKAGDRVYVAAPGSSGTYAEKVVCAAAQVHPLPATNSFGQGASLGVPYATAYRALFQRAGATAGETVLVHGATGGVGIAAVEFARARGLFVICTGSTDKGWSRCANTAPTFCEPSTRLRQRHHERDQRSWRDVIVKCSRT